MLDLPSPEHLSNAYPIIVDGAEKSKTVRLSSIQANFHH